MRRMRRASHSWYERDLLERLKRSVLCDSTRQGYGTSITDEVVAEAESAITQHPHKAQGHNVLRTPLCAQLC
jgi:hypothetical protein